VTLKKLVKTFLIIIVLSQTISVFGNEYYQGKFNTTKKLYLGAIMSNDKKEEVRNLKKIIRYGEKLNIDTLKYRRELNRIDNTPVVSNQVKSVIKSKFTIKSVVQSSNSITINFNKNINSSYIDFEENKKGNIFFDEFYIKGNFKDASPTILTIKGIDRVKIYQKDKNLLALTLRDTKNPKTIYIINKDQIVIKVLSINPNLKMKSRKVQKKTIKEKVKLLNRNILYPSKKIIVIDAGHGGNDPGAHYKRKILEKDITLKISKYLKEDLERKGFKVYLTRSRDNYVKLSRRTKYANKKRADIFVSIHANAVPKSKANRVHGVESYFLSPARSKRAKRVAALENKGDMSGMGWSSKNSLLTILNRAKITAANKMAIDIQKNMLFTLRKRYGIKTIRDGGVREGPFWVLVGAQMPSVLVEVGYVSHPKEGRRIATRSYQKLVAKGIAKGIESYFIKN
jgi:N-acetylmuramoyl-L-alanine amidase